MQSNKCLLLHWQWSVAALQNDYDYEDEDKEDDDDVVDEVARFCCRWSLDVHLSRGQWGSGKSSNRVKLLSLLLSSLLML